MATLSHQNNFATNLTSNTSAGATTSPLNSIPTVDAPYYLAFDATNLNSHYEVVLVTSDTATNVNHAATTYDHTTAEEVRMIIPSAEMNNLATVSTQADGAWVSFTPSWASLTVGSATNTGYYTQIGKTVFFRVLVILAADSSITGNPILTLPITAKSMDVGFIGQCLYIDTGTENYVGMIDAYGSLRIANVGATYPTRSSVTATIPHTWANTDTMYITGTYEAA